MSDFEKKTVKRTFLDKLLRFISQTVSNYYSVNYGCFGILFHIPISFFFFLNLSKVLNGKKGQKGK